MMKHDTLYIYRTLLLFALLSLGSTGDAWGQIAENAPSTRPSADRLRLLINGYRRVNTSVPNNAANIYTTDNWEIRKIQPEGNYWVYDIYWLASSWPSPVDPSAYPSNISLQSATGILSQSTQVLYAHPGEEKEIRFQQADGSTNNIDGFVHWYVAGENGQPSADQRMIDWRTGTPDPSEAHQFQNGLAWLRGKEGLKLCLRYEEGRDGGTFSAYNNQYAYSSYSEDGADSSSKPYSDGVKFSVPDNASEGTVYYVVCDASSRNDATGGNNRVTTPPISFRRTYKIVVTDNRFAGLTDNAFDNSGNLTEAARANPEKYFIENNKIHTPVRIGTNYRLAEPLGSYVLPNGVTPTRIRWWAYDSKGEKLGKQPTESSEIIRYTFPTEVGIYYLTAEVAAVNGTTWYPASFFQVHLEEGIEPLTKEQLEDKAETDPAYKYRVKESLLAGRRYDMLKEIRFESENDILEGNIVGTLSGDKKLNVRENLEGLEFKETYYAFADPRNYTHRKGQRASVGRGEYALYRTLNYQGISDVGNDYIGESRYQGIYNDYFGSSDTHSIVDRTWETNTGAKSGYFFYVDAADEPGMITKIPVEILCANTSLVVTAWVCNASSTGSGNKTELGIVFKRESQSGEETVLTQYYSGEIERKVKEGSNIFPWQQVAFKFSFKEDMTGDADDRYYVEIINNSDGSSGADFAIDDIRVYRSLPNIEVQRQDACTASTLQVSSEYETIRLNMGWDLEADVLDQVDEEKKRDMQFRKFRYGLMGPELETDLNNVAGNLKYLGNIYFSCVDGNVEGVPKAKDWITINEWASGKTDNPALSKALRIAVPSDTTKYKDVPGSDNDLVLPHNAEEALAIEYTLNIRAIRDFVYDVESDMWQTQNRAMTTDGELYKQLHAALYEADAKGNKLWNSDDNSNGTDGEGNHVGAANIQPLIERNPGMMVLYQRSVGSLFEFLGIPRIRVPWHDGNKVYLDALNVNNTDLHFKGERNPEGGIYSGEYQIVMFSADHIAQQVNPDETVHVNFKDPCTLASPFVVVPSITIAVDTETQTSGVTCLGSIHTLHATLMVAVTDDFGNLTGEMVDFEDSKYAKEDGRYTFDWFLGSMEEYNNLIQGDRDLQTILKELRNSLENDNDCQAITKEMVSQSTITDDEKQLLLSLLGDNITEPRLVSGKNVAFRWVKTVVAIPYVPDITEGEHIRLFCTEPQEFPLADELNVPDAPVGFPGVVYPDPDTDQKPFNAPLRLGLHHIVDGAVIENIPIRSDKITFGAEGTSLRMIDSKIDVMLRQSGSVYTKVGELTGLYVDNDKSTNNPNVLSFKFTVDNNSLFKEGEPYQLYIPFGEYGSNGTHITNSCEGYIVLDIKIVPEYLTWQGDADAVWYNDENWKQSTEAELYKGNKGETTDANGTDEVDKAFAPLYFTKITIPDGKTLPLEDEQGKLAIALQEGRLNLDSKDATDNIEYDMAVNNTGVNGAINVVPYYGNKVSEIYFKPEARLQRQQYLEYDTARVEFEMTEGQKYWMSSPLQDVFAGDMYAPKETARQNTYAFDPIFYSKGDNDRQNPSFYQKAWDKGVNIYTDASGTTSTPYSVVKSNWSVEYNDVNVPYALGKGFYASVEDIEGDNVSALVRLPKADKSYTYEELKTKAASTIANRPNAGKLAGNEDVTVVLTDNDAVGNWGDGNNQADGDGKHFLLGNPYMYPLSLEYFLNENTALENKFWTLKNGTAIVGTPDLEQGWNSGESGLMEIAPMQAFFVELKESLSETTTSVEIKFTPDMMVDEEEDAPSTRSVITASAPVLRLTAEKGGKRSIAYLTKRDDATNEYEADKDAITLLDSELAEIPQVYTVAGDRAAGVNAVKGITNIPLGVYTGSAQDEVTLTIEGISHFIGTLYLYDAQTRKSQALTGDSHTLSLTGSSHGRYFLRSGENPTGNEAISTDAISIYSAEAGKVIVCATAPLAHIRVVSMGGQVIRSLVPNQTVSTIRLPKGIYIVHAESNGVVKTEKVMVR